MCVEEGLIHKKDKERKKERNASLEIPLRHKESRDVQSY